MCFVAAASWGCSLPPWRRCDLGRNACSSVAQEVRDARSRRAGRHWNGARSNIWLYPEIINNYVRNECPPRVVLDNKVASNVRASSDLLVYAPPEHPDTTFNTRTKDVSSATRSDKLSFHDFYHNVRPIWNHQAARLDEFARQTSRCHWCSWKYLWCCCIHWRPSRNRENIYCRMGLHSTSVFIKVRHSLDSFTVECECGWLCCHNGIHFISKMRSTDSGEKYPHSQHDNNMYVIHLHSTRSESSLRDSIVGANLPTLENAPPDNLKPESEVDAILKEMTQFERLMHQSLKADKQTTTGYLKDPRMKYIQLSVSARMLQARGFWFEEDGTKSLPWPGYQDKYGDLIGMMQLKARDDLLLEKSQWNTTLDGRIVLRYLAERKSHCRHHCSHLSLITSEYCQRLCHYHYLRRGCNRTRGTITSAVCHKILQKSWHSLR